MQRYITVNRKRDLDIYVKTAVRSETSGTVLQLNIFLIEVGLSQKVKIFLNIHIEDYYLRRNNNSSCLKKKDNFG